jgi:hypothetical protein
LVGYAILNTNWLICDVILLAWLQLPVLSEYRLVTALVPLASDSRIVSVPPLLISTSLLIIALNS